LQHPRDDSRLISIWDDSRLNSLRDDNRLKSLRDDNRLNSIRDDSTLIKKKIKFSSYIRTFSGAVGRSYMRKGFLIYEEMRK
jgi:hypothetical protein